MAETKTYEEYLMDEKVEDVLVGYAVPQKAGERLRKLQQALHRIRGKSIRANGLPVLEGILLFGSFTRGKPEPGDIDIVPFFDFSRHETREKGFKDLVNRSNQAANLIQKLGKYYTKIGGRPQLGKLHFKEDDSCPQDYIDCTSDMVLARDLQQLRSCFLNAGWCSYIAPRRRFKPKVEHILGPQDLKNRFKKNYLLLIYGSLLQVRNRTEF